MSAVLRDREAILKLIPHQGAICLLDAVVESSETRITCRTQSHLDPANPLRRDGQLSPTALIEYGAQAMAIHAGLIAEARGEQAPPRLLVSAQAVGFACTDAAALAGPLTVVAERKLADARGALYQFEVSSASGRAAWGRVAVLAAPQQA